MSFPKTFFILLLTTVQLCALAQKDTTRYVVREKTKEIEVHRGDSVFTVSYDHMVNSLLFDGIEKAKDGNLDGALEDFRSTFMYSEEYPDVYYNIGLVYYYKKQNSIALNYLNKALELAPDHYDALNQRGIVLSLLEQFDSALVDFDKAIDIKPFDGQAYMNKGVALLQKGDKLNACSFLNKALELGNEKAEDIINDYCK